MKKIIISAVIFLSGCTLLDAYRLNKFDSNEYLLITQIRVMAHRFQTQCDSVLQSSINAQSINNMIELFAYYSEQQPHNQELTQSAKTLHEISQELQNRYDRSEPVGSAFCQLKFQSMEHMAQLIQNVSANRPR